MTTSNVMGWLRLLRVSNYPTVVTNALAGCAVGSIGREAIDWGGFAVAGAALLLLYAAGMIFNDVLDAATDRVERPQRPIPSGLVHRGQATLVGGVCILAAQALLFTRGMAAFGFGAALAAVIVAYDAVHRRWSGAVLLMAGCRGLAILTAAACAAWPIDWRFGVAVAGVLFVYTVGISVIARREAEDQRRVRIVMLLIAGICVIDAAWLGVMQRWVEGAIALACFAVTRAGQRKIAGS